MKVGIKYCGGCNPRYDREEYVRKLVSCHPEWETEYADEGVHYDLLYVIGGCTSCCASYEQYWADEVVKVDGEARTPQK